MERLPVELLGQIFHLVPEEAINLSFVSKSFYNIASNIRFQRVSLFSTTGDPERRLSQLLRVVTKQSSYQRHIKHLVVDWPTPKLDPPKASFVSQNARVRHRQEFKTKWLKDVQTLKSLETTELIDKFWDEHDNDFSVLLFILLSLTPILEEMTMHTPNWRAQSFYVIWRYLHASLADKDITCEELPVGMQEMTRFTSIDQNIINMQASKQSPTVDDMNPLLNAVDFTLLPSVKVINLHALLAYYESGPFMKKFAHQIACEKWTFSWCSIDNHFMPGLLALPKALKHLIYEAGGHKFGEQDINLFRDGIRTQKESLETFCFSLAPSCNYIEIGVCLGPFRNFPRLKYLYVSLEYLWSYDTLELREYQDDYGSGDEDLDVSEDDRPQLLLTKILPSGIEELGLDDRHFDESQEIDNLLDKVREEVFERKVDLFPNFKTLVFKDHLIKPTIHEQLSSHALEKFFNVASLFHIDIIMVKDWSKGVWINRDKTIKLSYKDGRVVCL